MININEYSWIKQNYEGVIEIYPSKCMNTLVLEKVLYELKKEYELVKIFNDWIRGFKK